MRNDPLRIAYFADIFPSGSETWVHHEIDALQKMGCVVMVFATYPRPVNLPPELTRFADITTYLAEQKTDWRAALKNITRYNRLKPVFGGFFADCPGWRLKAQVMRDLLAIFKLLPLVLKFSPDIMYVHNGASRANLALFLNIILGIPFCFKMHAADVYRRVALFRLKSDKAMLMLTISKYNIDYIRKHHTDIDCTSFRLHACGIPLNDFPFRLPRPMNALPTILSIGRMVKMKGFDVLLKASRILCDQGFRHRVVIIGWGREMDSLMRLRSELGLEDVVNFTGYMGPDRVRQSLESADIFVLPAVWDPCLREQDGVPIVLMEAMVMGVPAVSTVISGIPELIEDEKNGLLAKSSDPVSLAAKILKTYSMDDDSRINMLYDARKKIEEYHNIDKLTADLLKLFKRHLTSTPI